MLDPRAMRQRPGAVVIGSDQVLSVGSRLLHKAKDMAEARENLRQLRGMPHELHSAVALAGAGTVTTTHVDTARLTMRNFSDEFLDGYILRTGTACLESVGGYQIEAMGSQLFARIEGDHFTILGLPLLLLLEELRLQGVLLA